MTECPHCNSHNPPQAVTCRVCNLNVPRTNAPSLLHTTNRPKMAVFDLDKTLFDLSRRERVARRQGLKEGSDKWYEFLNQNKYILMDTPIAGTVSFVKQLSDSGFTIAYLSGRPRHSLAATKQSLQESGFPIDAAEQDLVFLHSGKGSIKNITNHKLSVLTHLKNSFDIDFFFDDTPEFRQAAKSLFIPGVYSSVASYTGKEERASASKKTKSKRPRKNPTLNPPPMPRKKRDKGGNMRKEPIKKYTERFMGDKKMNEEFPDRSQRFAVALSYARKFYSDAAVDKAYPPKSNPIGPFKKKEKPSAAVLQGVSLYREIWESEEKQRKEDAEYDGEKFTPRTLTASSWDDDYSDIVGNVIAPQSINVDWSYMEELFPLAKYLEGTLSINYYDIHNIKLKDFDTLKEAVDSKGDYDNIDEGFSRGVPSDQFNYMVIFTKRNLKRFQKLLDDPQRIPPKPKPVKPTPATGKKIVAWYNAYHEAINADDYENKSFLLTVYIDFGKYMRAEQSPMTLAQYSNNGYEAVKGMFAVLKGVGYTPEWMDTHEGEPVTWAKFMKYGTLTSNGKKSWNFHDAHLTVDTDREYALRVKIEGYNKLMGYLQYLADEGKINGSLTPSGFRFDFNKVKDNPRSNPHTPVHEAKSFYKQFHQKPAKNVKKTKVDIGDTWVGLGKAWSIGYRSGKETGNEAQKYIHNFGIDEESGKQFKEPELYYVKNNDGSQMMVIMGGDWYIDTAEDGSMSWIYI